MKNQLSDQSYLNESMSMNSPTREPDSTDVIIKKLIEKQNQTK